jgi:hypothetical protein
MHIANSRGREVLKLFTLSLWLSVNILVEENATTRFSRIEREQAVGVPHVIAISAEQLCGAEWANQHVDLFAFEKLRRGKRRNFPNDCQDIRSSVEWRDRPSSASSSMTRVKYV